MGGTQHLTVNNQLATNSLAIELHTNFKLTTGRVTLIVTTVGCRVSVLGILQQNRIGKIRFLPVTCTATLYVHENVRVYRHRTCECSCKCAQCAQFMFNRINTIVLIRCKDNFCFYDPTVAGSSSERLSAIAIYRRLRRM